MLLVVILHKKLLFLDGCEIERQIQKQRIIRRIMMKKTMRKICLVLALVLLLSSCAFSSSKDKLKIVDSKISEGKLVTAMIKMLVEDRTDVVVEVLEAKNALNSYKEVERGNADAFKTYDGTVLATFLRYSVKAVPEGSTVYEFVNEKLAEDNLELLKKLGNNNTYAIAVTPAVMEKYNLKTISDLAECAPELVFCAEHEFFNEEGNIKFGTLSEKYGLTFKDTRSVDIAMKYLALFNEGVDVALVYATDGMNLATDLVILEDDKGFFPDYYGALMVRSEIFDKYGKELRDVMNLLEGLLPNDEMTKLTYEVDVKLRDVNEVAKEFLVEKGLLK